MLKNHPTNFPRGTTARLQLRAVEVVRGPRQLHEVHVVLDVEKDYAGNHGRI